MGSKHVAEWIILSSCVWWLSVYSLFKTLWMTSETKNSGWPTDRHLITAHVHHAFVQITHKIPTLYASRYSILSPYTFHGAATPSGPGSPHYPGFTITLRHTTRGRTPLDEWSAPSDTSNWQITTLTRDTCVPTGIQTRNPSKRATADPRLRLRGHWNPPCMYITRHRLDGIYSQRVQHQHIVNLWRGTV